MGFNSGFKGLTFRIGGVVKNHKILDSWNTDISEGVKRLQK